LKRLLKKAANEAAGERKPEAYPPGYVEDFVEPRTKLGAFFSSLRGEHERDSRDQRTTDSGFTRESDNRGGGHAGEWSAWAGGGAVRGFDRRKISD
jgi:hypothetical protein